MSLKRSFFYFTNKVLYVGCICAVIFSTFSSCNKKDSSIQSPWDKMYKILKEVKEPEFPNSEFNIIDFGAKPDGKTDNTEAFKEAIAFCAKKGGGKIIVPKGTFLTGPIHLESFINLHLNEGAEIIFSKNIDDYYPLVPTSYEGIALMNFSPLIYAHKKTNIAITGKGTLNGQADTKNWWPWCGKNTYGWKKGTPNQKDSLSLPRLMEMGQSGTPLRERVFGKGHYLRPTFIEPYECSQVLIKGIKIVNAPFWVIHPFKSKNVIVDGVHIESHGPNNDGCNPEYSKNIIIKNSTFNTGDDCIAIKAGRDAEGRRVAIKSENIVVQNCNMIDGHGGVVIGSEMSGGVKNVFVENCKMSSPNLDRAIRLKTNSRRGGRVDGLYVRNLEVGQVKEAVLKLNMHYATYKNQTGEFMPEIENVYLENIRVKNGGKYAILAKGYKESPIINITLKNVKIEKVEQEFLLENVKNLNLIDTYINGKLVSSPKN